MEAMMFLQVGLYQAIAAPMAAYAIAGLLDTCKLRSLLDLVVDVRCSVDAMDPFYVSGFAGSGPMLQLISVRERMAQGRVRRP